MIIKKAEVENLEQIYSLDKNNFTNVFNREYYKEKINNNEIIISLDNDEILGYLLFQNIIDESELYKIVVREDKRKQGIASKLMDYYIENSISDKIVKFVLEVRERNISAKNLYEKYNYKTVRIIENYYTNPNENGLLMIKEVE